MIYVSELTGKRYKTAEECEKADLAYQQAQEKAKQAAEAAASERSKDAKALEETYKELVAVREKYSKQLDAFIDKYGSYHMTYNRNSADDLLETFLRIW